MEHKIVLYEGKFKRFVSKNNWEYVEGVHHEGVVVILAMTDAKEVILIEQYRIPVEKNVIEFPAGLVSDMEHCKDETLEEAARRELLEETGYEAKEMIHLLTGPGAPAGSSDLLSLFRAKGVKKVGAGGGDHTESIETHLVSLDKVEAWLKQKEAEGYLIDPKIYAGLYFLNKGE